MEFGEMVYQVLAVLLTGLAGFAVQAFRVYLKRKGVIEWMDAKERIVDKAVLLVAAMYEDLDADSFKQAAIAKASKRLKENGIKITKQDLNELVDETIQEIKMSWE